MNPSVVAPPVYLRGPQEYDGLSQLNNVSPKQQAAVLGDRFADCKRTYDKHGGERTNFAYGYINKG